MKVPYVERGITKSTEHRVLLQTGHISLIFHITVSVSFQDTILGTIKMKALPVIEVLRLCKQCWTSE